MKKLKKKFVSYNTKTGELTSLGENIVKTLYIELHEVCVIVKNGILDIEPINESDGELEILISSKNLVYVYGQQNSLKEANKKEVHKVIIECQK